MTRDGVLNSHVCPIITEMTAMKQIPASYVCSKEERRFKEFLVDESLSQICSTDEDGPKGIIVDECSAEEDESECIHKNINKQK